jgi:hypothetical protein
MNTEFVVLSLVSSGTLGWAIMLDEIVTQGIEIMLGAAMGVAALVAVLIAATTEKGPNARTALVAFIVTAILGLGIAIIQFADWWGGYNGILALFCVWIAFNVVQCCIAGVPGQ